MPLSISGPSVGTRYISITVPDVLPEELRNLVQGGFWRIDFPAREWSIYQLRIGESKLKATLAGKRAFRAIKALHWIHTHQPGERPDPDISVEVDEFLRKLNPSASTGQNQKEAKTKTRQRQPKQSTKRGDKVSNQHPSPSPGQKDIQGGVDTILAGMDQMLKGFFGLMGETARKNLQSSGFKLSNLFAPDEDDADTEASEE